MSRWHALPSRFVPLQVEALEDRCVPSSAEYVTALYGDILHRAPGPAEVAGWVAVLNAGTSPEQLALAFTTSSEYQANTIRADYEMFLGRQPAPAELAGWLGQAQAGLGQKQVEATFLASDEFFARHKSNPSSWLEGVYHDVLGRGVDPGGLRAWTQSLQAGATRNAVALAIVDSSEADTRLVTGAYHELLERNPDPPGLSNSVAALGRGLSPSQLLAILAGSEEYIALTAHGALDVVPQPVPVVVPTEVFVSDPFLFDPFLVDPFAFESDGFDSFDFGGFDGGDCGCD
jgi:hypothetical protein